MKSRTQLFARCRRLLLEQMSRHYHWFKRNLEKYKHKEIRHYASGIPRIRDWPLSAQLCQTHFTAMP